MKTFHSWLRDHLCSPFLLSLILAGSWGWQPAAAADAARRVPVRPLLRHTLPVGETTAPALPAGLKLVDWTQIRAEYERHRHGMFADEQGGYQSRSHYHRWLARFDGKGFTVKPDRDGWSWGLELERWGRLGEEISARRVERMDNKVNRLEYRRQGITEWFENDPEGLECGFTIPERPRGEGGERLLQLRRRGDLVAGLDGGVRRVSYKTAQGGPALRYRKLVASDSTGRRLPARMVAGGLFLRIFGDDRRAVYPVTVDPITQQAYLKASNTGANDSFGWLTSIAISGDSLVVGAYGEDSNATGLNGTQSDNSAADSGAAYVFVRSGGMWSQQAYLKASNTGQGDRFGLSVAISGNTVVARAYLDTRSSTGLEATRGEHNAITPSRLPLWASWSPECWQGGFLVARFVVPYVYDPVVLGVAKLIANARLGGITRIDE